MNFIRSKRRWIVLLTIVTVITLVLGHFLRGPETIKYQTVPVIKGDLEKNVLATGKLDAVRKVDVGAQVSGQLQNLHVEVGDKVVEGQLLALIDPKPAQNQVKEVEATIKELNADLIEAKAQLKLAQLTLKRQNNLAKVQAVSLQELDQVKTDVEVKRAKIENLLAQISKNQASLDTAQTNLQYTRITAPMDGIVVNIKTLQGQTVIAAQEAPTILTLADLGTMLVKAEVSEADVIYLKPGQKASFTVLGAPDKNFPGVLKDILPTPEKINDAIFFYARFEVANPQQLLRLQMTAQVKIQLDSYRDTLMIPLSALGKQITPTRYEVDILNGGKEEKREVTVGVRNDVNIQILSGLKEHEQVITGHSEAGDE
ncbi:macrolide transporter subunit MacA [Photorhabdus laumondii subsp. laumondii]|uniref:Macrolide-specific efflux protein MacA n=2 Tax=Photorhabdus laumondii subsp. laumondii TaxID=141679 RepID=Q7N6G0_PHOLL|nr:MULTISPECIES: macrolide transporter subunit MacA [Photorhabdus]AWK41441.1 efflux transporter periplasmic adaptor subunit [Photorhabdus laumondii subsp. laumondii]AXG42171.1 macrolide transporter subunit MacA [Photorhabdus laumondii subsp. laumondii]AXG46763.1 macrolide transporter subunit MacA [Photorhabdus laumondii subsp. laumondii]MCC8384134.1 macrolide transporter subunit MacA [Photorhabdus laumondii]MCC8388562.1 macrolide transporter subunit MacA [Photorhabdus laumondii]